ncbi:hypothetical protein QN386_25685, partial [Pseudomonas sp. CCI3.2]
PAGIFSSVPIVLGGVPLPGTPALPLAPGEVPVLTSPVIPSQQRIALLSQHQSRCLLCEEASQA